MARDWGNEQVTLALIEARMYKLAPANTAPMPIAMSKERQDDGTFVWLVNLHVRVPLITEYEVEGAGHSLAGAMRRAYLGLNNEANLRVNADRANLQFGVSV